MIKGIIIWLVLLVAFLVVEGLTAQLTTIWFAAGGALLAAVACWLGAGTVAQLLLFIGLSVVLLVFTRPLAMKYAKKDIETNVNSLPGTTAVVTRKVDNLAQTGQVRLNDVDWLARSTEDDVTIPEGAVVEIVEVQGVKLIIKEIKKEEKKNG